MATMANDEEPYQVYLVSSEEYWTMNESLIQVNRVYEG